MFPGGRHHAGSRGAISLWERSADSEARRGGPRRPSPVPMSIATLPGWGIGPDGATLPVPTPLRLEPARVNRDWPTERRMEGVLRPIGAGVLTACLAGTVRPWRVAYTAPAGASQTELRIACRSGTGAVRQTSQLSPTSGPARLPCLRGARTGPSFLPRAGSQRSPERRLSRRPGTMAERRAALPAPKPGRQPGNSRNWTAAAGSGLPGPGHCAQEKLGGRSQADRPSGQRWPGREPGRQADQPGASTGAHRRVHIGGGASTGSWR